MPIMVLFGGERDGEEIKGVSGHPDVYYAVPNADESRIKIVRGKAAQTELRNRLSRLAYRYSGEASTESRFVMVRAAELDKVSQ